MEGEEATSHKIDVLLLRPSACQAEVWLLQVGPSIPGKAVNMYTILVSLVNYPALD